MSEVERESMEVDVLFVGAGPASLSSAIHLMNRVEAFNREVEGLDDIELWIHTCWGNPNMQRVIDNDSYKESFELYMHALKGDVWTVEMSDRNFREIDLFASLRGRLPKKVAVGVVSHRSLQVETPEVVAGRVRLAMEHIDGVDLAELIDTCFNRMRQPIPHRHAILIAVDAVEAALPCAGL